MNGLETKLDPEKFIMVFFLQAREQCQYSGPRQSGLVAMEMPQMSG